MTEDLPIRGPTIDLDQLLKLAGAVSSGGQAKQLIAENAVSVNDQPESRRRRTLRPGDIITLTDGRSWRVVEKEEGTEGPSEPGTEEKTTNI